MVDTGWYQDPLYEISHLCVHPFMNKQLLKQPKVTWIFCTCYKELQGEKTRYDVIACTSMVTTISRSEETEANRKIEMMQLYGGDSKAEDGY